eukprot:13085194-Ditylum_brightwellii.AAC.1
MAPLTKMKRTKDTSGLGNKTRNHPMLLLSTTSKPGGDLPTEDELTSNQHLTHRVEIAEDAPPEPLIVHPDGKHNEDLYDAILTAYHKFNDAPVDEWPKIPKLKWSAKSKQLIVAAGKEAA